MPTFSNICFKCYPFLILPTRGRKVAGWFPWLAATYQQRLDAISAANKEAEPTDIGWTLPERRTSQPHPTSNYRRRAAIRKKHTLPAIKDENIPVELIDLNQDPHLFVRRFVSIAQHYNIFNDVLGKGRFFHPVLDLAIEFDSPAAESSDGTTEADKTQNMVIPVFSGNIIPPCELTKAPSVTISPSSLGQLGIDLTDSSYFCTIICTCPDESVYDSPTEVLHWLHGNARLHDVLATGETTFPYTQPFPAYGTGFHRYVFLLYLHKNRITLPTLNSNVSQLEARRFSTAEFIERHCSSSGPVVELKEDQIVPVGLKFFQSEWDDSVRDVYHNVLGLKHPVYEYDWPEMLKYKQRKFPLRKAFNDYLDRYKDRKAIKEEVMKEYLPTVDPLKPPWQPFEYPNTYKISPEHSTWQHYNATYKRLRQRKYQYAPPIPPGPTGV